MKNLNKKTGTIALAGMLIAGGVAVSGISAYADSFDLSQKNDIQRVEFFCKNNNASKLNVMKSEKELKESLNEYARTKRYNNGHVTEVKNPADIASHIREAKRYKKEVMGIKLHGLYYLIKVN
jgi:hypothetical protein